MKTADGVNKIFNSRLFSQIESSTLGYNTMRSSQTLVWLPYGLPNVRVFTSFQCCFQYLGWPFQGSLTATSAHFILWRGKRNISVQCALSSLLFLIMIWEERLKSILVPIWGTLHLNIWTTKSTEWLPLPEASVWRFLVWLQIFTTIPYNGSPNPRTAWRSGSQPGGFCRHESFGIVWRPFDGYDQRSGLHWVWAARDAATTIHNALLSNEQALPDLQP